MTTPVAQTSRADLFQRTLAATILHPGLDAILLVDADYEQLNNVAGILASLLEATHGAVVAPLLLQATASDDELWGLPRWPVVSESLTNDTECMIDFGPLPGSRSLLENDWSSTQCLLVIPDLSRAERPLVRAMLQMIGQRSISLERYGASRLIQNRSFWLAACANSRLREISPHVFDRLPLRFWVPDMDMSRLDRLKSGVLDPMRSISFVANEAWLETLKNPTPTIPVLSKDAIEQLQIYLKRGPSSDLRGPLGLIRLAAGLATLDHATEISVAHVDEAATALTPPAARSRSDAILSQQRSSRKGSVPQSSETVMLEKQSCSVHSDKPEISCGSVDAADSAYIAATEPLDVDLPDYNNRFNFIDSSSTDIATAATAFSLKSLASSLKSTERSRIQRGEILGTCKARVGDNIALMPTVFEALRWQRYRCTRRPATKLGIIIRREDLRTWRRAPPAADLLVVVLDTTAVQGTRWFDEMKPFIADAYRNRSRVSVIIVGANTVDGICAERIDCRNVLAPRLNMLLSRTPVGATPLAHGLRLALSAIESALRRGRSPQYQICLTVFTDGRGNVKWTPKTGQ